MLPHLPFVKMHFFQKNESSTEAFLLFAISKPCAAPALGSADPLSALQQTTLFALQQTISAQQHVQRR